MSNSSRSLLLALFGLLALFNTLTLAAPTSGSHVLTARHPKGGSASKKRFDNARLTYYDAGQNACGWYDSDSDYVIALSPKLYNNGAHCGKMVTVDYQGKQVQAKVTDECPGCNEAEADLSRPLFAHLAPLDEGVIHGRWWFN
ncbi:RlpA-like double-psi beta-barrel-protein domain-containing protein-containing protein [Fomes fomentarius]|nr:RlpA-like double-psi beta-barrel-protein domain-containing protein-containing protein [Fomes fomentarius]